MIFHANLILDKFDWWTAASDVGLYDMSWLCQHSGVPVLSSGAIYMHGMWAPVKPLITQSVPVSHIKLCVACRQLATAYVCHRDRLVICKFTKWKPFFRIDWKQVCFK